MNTKSFIALFVLAMALFASANAAPTHRQSLFLGLVLREGLLTLLTSELAQLAIRTKKAKTSNTHGNQQPAGAHLGTPACTPAGSLHCAAFLPAGKPQCCPMPGASGTPACPAGSSPQCKAKVVPRDQGSSEARKNSGAHKSSKQT